MDGNGIVVQWFLAVNKQLWSATQELNLERGRFLLALNWAFIRFAFLGKGAKKKFRCLHSAIFGQEEWKWKMQCMRSIFLLAHSCRLGFFCTRDLFSCVCRTCWTVRRPREDCRDRRVEVRTPQILAWPSSWRMLGFWRDWEGVREGFHGGGWEAVSDFIQIELFFCINLAMRTHWYPFWRNGSRKGQLS